MGTYYIPRNVKGEGRILFVFSGKSMVITVALGGIAFLLFYLPLSMFGMKTIGFIIVGIFALIGFAIGTFKVPEIPSIAFTKKIGGENLDEIGRRALKFKKNRKIYIYEEENKNG